MTPKQQVLAKVASAECRYMWFDTPQALYVIIRPSRRGKYVEYGAGSLPRAAWADAARRIKEQK